jgi:hypothetical protein
MSGNGGRKSLTASYWEAAIGARAVKRIASVSELQICARVCPLAGAEQATKSATDQEIGGIDSGQHKASM